MIGTKVIRVLWVDDNDDFRALLVRLLADYKDFQTVGAMGSADGLEERVAELNPDVIVLDLSMPGRSPLEALRSTAAMFPQVRILICSSYSHREAIDEAMAAGAAGYLVKEGDFDDLTEAIRRVANGEKVLPRER